MKPIITISLNSLSSFNKRLKQTIPRQVSNIWIANSSLFIWQRVSELHVLTVATEALVVVIVEVVVIVVLAAVVVAVIVVVVAELFEETRLHIIFIRNSNKGV